MGKYVRKIERVRQRKSGSLFLVENYKNYGSVNLVKAASPMRKRRVIVKSVQKQNRKTFHYSQISIF